MSLILKRIKMLLLPSYFNGERIVPFVERYKLLNPLTSFGLTYINVK